MGTAKRPQPVKLIASLFSGHRALLEVARDQLQAIFGAIDFQSEILPFDHTDYYAAEFGPDLERLILAFERLIDPGALSAVKTQTNQLEAR
jgi:hypothetical protein